MSRWHSSAPITSKVAPTRNCTVWPSPWAGGSLKTDSPTDRGWPFSPTITRDGSRLYLGIIASGCVAVPLDTALHDDQVTKLLKNSGASAVFCDAKHLPVAQPAATELNLGLILMDPDRMTSHSIEDHWLGNLPAIFDAGPGKFKPAPASDDDLASLLYTSGTTADPKGVMLTHANFLGEVEAVFNWVDLGPTDALLGVLPLFHVLALMANLLLPLVKGSRVVYLETLNTTELLRALTRA